MTTRMFGAEVARSEDRRLLTGQGCFVDDVGHDALEVAFVRSPHAHARITGIHVDAALDVDGLVAIYTYEDLPEGLAKPLPVLIPHPALTHPRVYYPLARDEVNHVGEAVAMVVATDRYVAEDAADAIRVDYETLPPVVGVENAREARHLVHDDCPATWPRTWCRKRETRSGRSGARRTAWTWRSMWSAARPRRWRARRCTRAGMLATARCASTRRRRHPPACGRRSRPFWTCMPLDSVEVIAPDVGGGFGVKITHPWPEEVLLAWAARVLGNDQGCEVKWTEDRREHFVSSAHERRQLQRVRVGFDDAGRILGLHVEIDHDNGAYTPYGIIVPIISTTQLLGPYKPGGYRVECRSLYTNTVTVTPYRGAGRPQGVYAMEWTMDAIARYLDADRAAVRAANLLQPEEMPYDHGLTFQDGRPLIYDSGDFPKSLESIKELIGWDEFESYRERARAEGRRVGIGLACYVEGTGVGPYEGGHVRVEPSGRVAVATGLTTQGQGHETMLAQIVADELGVALSDISVTTGDTRRFGYAVGTFASRAAVMSGNAVALATRVVTEKAKRIAADALEADPRDLEIDGGVLRVKGSPASSIDLKTVAVLSNPLRYAFDEASRAATQFSVGDADPTRPPVVEEEEPGLEGTDYYSPPHSTFANGMHAAIVETDPQTAEVSILRYCVVHDCGKLINPMIVEGQIHGGVAQGVGGALYERMVYDEYGQLLNASFMAFLMPYATEIPKIETEHLETPSPLNPLGVKGAGEAGVIPGMALFASAIEDAEGIPVSRMPISPSELFELRRGKGHMGS